jgi:hypothetical protein
MMGTVVEYASVMIPEGLGRNRRNVSHLNQMYLWQGQFKQHCCMSISLVEHADIWANRGHGDQVPAIIYLFDNDKRLCFSWAGTVSCMDFGKLRSRDSVHSRWVTQRSESLT